MTVQGTNPASIYFMDGDSVSTGKKAVAISSPTREDSISVSEQYALLLFARSSTGLILRVMHKAKEIVCLSLFLIVAGCAGKGPPMPGPGELTSNVKEVTALPTNMVLGEGEGDNPDQIYKLKLSTKPTGDVIVEPSSSDPGAATVVPVEPNSLIFTPKNWEKEQQVRVRPVNDKDADDECVIIKHSVSGGGYGEVTVPNIKVTVNDNDNDTVPTFYESVENQDYIKGAEIDLLWLPSAKGGNDPLSYSLSDNNGGLPAGLRFNFNESGQRLSGTPTEAQEATIYTYTVTDADLNTSSSDKSSLTFAIKVTAKEVIASATDMNLREGEGGKVYKLKLSTKPMGDVIVVPSSSDQGAATVVPVEPNSLTFTPKDWGKEQQVRVRPVSDINFDEEKVTIKHKVSGGGYDQLTGPTVVVTVNDDIASFTIPRTEHSFGVTKFWGIIIIVTIIIIVGIIMRYKNEIFGYMVEWGGNSRIVIKERKKDIVVGIFLIIIASALASAKENLGCK